MGGLSYSIAPFLLLVLVFFIVRIMSQKKRTNRVPSFNRQKAREFEKNVYTYFSAHKEIVINDDIKILGRVSELKGRVDLTLMYGKEMICNLEDMRTYFPTAYQSLLEMIYNMTKPVGFTEPVKVKKEEMPQQKVKEPARTQDTKLNARYYINHINELNLNIKEELITNDLFQTTAMLQQIELIEKKYPDSLDKLKKLYTYYLPILISILENYEKLITSNSTHEEIEKLELKLRKTIVLINEALKTITMQLCEEDIVDMDADMSVLQTILRRDGLVREGTLYAENNEEVEQHG